MTPGGSKLRAVLGLGAAQMLGWGSTYYLPAILAGPMAAELGMTPSGVFAAFSAALATSAVLGPWAGRRIDRLGGRGVLAGSSLVFALGLALMGVATGPAQVWAAWLILGAGMAAGLYDAAFATLAGAYGRAARGPITGITLLGGLASTLAWPVTAWIEAEAGWRAACLFWAAAHLLVGLPLNLLTAPRGEGQAAPATPVEAAEDAGAARGAAFWLLAFVFAASWFVSTAMAAHLPALLVAAGATPAAAIAAGALVGPAQVGGRLLEFALGDRVHPLVSARLATGAHPAGTLALLAFGAPAAAVFAVLHGAGNGVLTIAKGTLPLALFGPAGYGRRLGLMMAPAHLAQAAAPLAFAALIEAFGVGALGFSTALGLASLAALAFVRRGPDRG